MTPSKSDLLAGVEVVLMFFSGFLAILSVFLIPVGLIALVVALWWGGVVFGIIGASIAFFGGFYFVVRFMELANKFEWLPSLGLFSLFVCSLAGLSTLV